MSLADLIQKGGLRAIATATVATVATGKAESLPTVASVATVSVASGPDSPAQPWRVTWPDGKAPPPDVAQRLRAASLALDAAQAGMPEADPDRWCWPNGTAWNGAEVQRFSARLVRFVSKGLLAGEAEAIAEKLVQRDREQDGRRMCLECSHLRRVGGWGCGAWQQAGNGSAALSADMLQLLQRCDGFKDATT